MYKKNISKTSFLTKNEKKNGETIERKMERIVSNKEPIKDGAPLIFNERKEGVKPEHDIRTDRFEIAVIGMDKIDKSIKAKREEKAKMQVVKDGEAEPTEASQQGTDNK